MLLSEQRLHAFDAALSNEKVIFGKTSAESFSYFIHFSSVFIVVDFGR